MSLKYEPSSEPQVCPEAAGPISDAAGARLVLAPRGARRQDPRMAQRRLQHRDAKAGPLPSEYGTHTTFTARLWPWLSVKVEDPRMAERRLQHRDAKAGLGPMAILGRGTVAYERGTPVVGSRSPLHSSRRSPHGSTPTSTSRRKSRSLPLLYYSPA